MADTPDPKQAESTQVSADGAVELTEAQLDTAEGGLGLLPGALSHEGIKLTAPQLTVGTLTHKWSTMVIKH
jgi:hypothetical protein